MTLTTPGFLLRTTFTTVPKSLISFWSDSMNGLQFAPGFLSWIPFMASFLGSPGIECNVPPVFVVSRPWKAVLVCLDYGWFGKKSPETYGVSVMENCVYPFSSSNDLFPAMRMNDDLKCRE